MAGPLPDEAVVCRGGTCTAQRFREGSGVSIGGDGRLGGISVNASAQVDLKVLSTSIPNRELGVTTVGAIRIAGGDVISSPSSRNPYHCVMSGLTSEAAQILFTPVQPNPNME